MVKKMELIRPKEAAQRCAHSRTALRALEAKGQFPEGMKISPKVKVYLAVAVKKWVRDRIKGVDLPDGVSFKYDKHGLIVPAQ